MELTDRQPVPVSVDWGHMEAQLGTVLPGDFKELCESFGPGEFNDYLIPYASNGERHLGVCERLGEIRRVFDRNPNAGLAYTPHHIFTPGRGGLIPWGGTAREGEEFFWLAGEGDPDCWPTVARTDAPGEWAVFDISTGEFIYRAVTEADFRLFSAVRYAPAPTFSSYLEDMDS
jgi:hypothetical protein